MTATDRTPPPLKWLCLGNRDANDGFELFAHGIYARNGALVGSKLSLRERRQRVDLSAFLSGAPPLLARRRSSTCWRASCACTGTTPTSNCSARTSFPCMPAAWATPGSASGSWPRPGNCNSTRSNSACCWPSTSRNPPRRSTWRPRPATRQRRAHRAAPATHRYRRSPVLRRGRRRPLRLPGPGRAPACPRPADA